MFYGVQNGHHLMPVVMTSTNGGSESAPYAVAFLQYESGTVKAYTVNCSSPTDYPQFG